MEIFNLFPQYYYFPLNLHAGFFESSIMKRQQGKLFAHQDHRLKPEANLPHVLYSC